MDFKLIWTEPAINDLEEIVAFLAAQQGMAKARVLGFGIFNKVEILALFPEIGSALIEKDDLCWRKLIFKTRRFKSEVQHSALKS